MVAPVRFRQAGIRAGGLQPPARFGETLVRFHDTYEIVCARCETPFATESNTGTCPNCNIPFEVIWQAARTAIVPARRKRLARRAVSATKRPRRARVPVAVVSAGPGERDAAVVEGGR